MAGLFAFDEERARFESIRRRLTAAQRPVVWESRLDPLSQLIRACLGSRTRDAVSWKAFFALAAAYPDWADMAAARPDEVLGHIAEVTYAEDKARHLIAALRMIEARTGGLSLAFLADVSIESAHAWLEGLPNAGPKVAAAVLNFSTLNRRSMVVDTHVQRVASRYGLVAVDADIREAWTTLMETLPDDWSAPDLAAFHVQLKRLGQTHCRPSAPRCEDCPIADGCAVRRRAGQPCWPSHQRTASASRALRSG